MVAANVAAPGDRERMTAKTDQRAELKRRFAIIRRSTEELCRSLTPEDYVLQSMPDASPVKWHLAHTSWFFETFVLAKAGLPPLHSAYGYLFNSYYNAVGERHCRPRRGLLSRPTAAEVYRYRAQIDERVVSQIDSLGQARFADLAPVIELGLHHEQQHQELLLTDIKHAFAQNPLRPAYRDGGPGAADPSAPRADPPALGWIGYAEGVAEIGWAGEGFAFDNEGPRHRVYQRTYQLADRLVTSGEYLDFIAEGGYRRPDLWLSEGWAAAGEQGWEAPLYWERREGRFQAMSLDGMRDIDPAEPVCHVSYYEADAYARFAGARLPTEAEWEIAAASARIEGNFVESGALHPAALRLPEAAGPSQLFGDVWEWTASGYSPYPGFKPMDGALGEYNGKFMCNQLVLRGGSCATPVSHIRATYRNFFPPQARWQFSGIRLARDAVS
jgi:ergothioneine biosynthesis protein EgtB